MKNILFSTSMNIDSTLMEQLDEICKQYGISRSDLIKLILKCVCKKYQVLKSATGLTRYQKQQKGHKWKCVRIDFSEEECALFFQTRFKYRVSVSKLLFIGFVLFLDEILEELNGNDKEKSPISNSYTLERLDLLPYMYEEVIFFGKIEENKKKNKKK